MPKMPLYLTRSPTFTNNLQLAFIILNVIPQWLIPHTRAYPFFKRTHRHAFNDTDTWVAITLMFEFYQITNFHIYIITPRSG